MTQLVVGVRSGDGWTVEVRGVGTTTSAELPGIEAAARALLAAEGHENAADVDLQLLLPDFEMDLEEKGLPHNRHVRVELVSGMILLAVVIGALAFVLGRVL